MASDRVGHKEGKTLSQRLLRFFYRQREMLSCNPPLIEGLDGSKFPKPLWVKTVCGLLKALQSAVKHNFTALSVAAIGTVVLYFYFGPYKELVGDLFACEKKEEILSQQVTSIQDRNDDLSQQINDVQERLEKVKIEAEQFQIDAEIKEAEIQQLNEDLAGFQDYLESSSLFMIRIYDQLNEEQRKQVMSIMRRQGSIQVNEKRLSIEHETIGEEEGVTTGKAWPRQKLTSLREEMAAIQDSFLKALSRGVFSVREELAPLARTVQPGQCRVFVAGGLTKSDASNQAKKIDNINAIFAPDLFIRSMIQDFPGTKRFPEHSRYSVLLALSDHKSTLEFFPSRTAVAVRKKAMEHERLGPEIRRNDPYVRCL